MAVQLTRRVLGQITDPAPQPVPETVPESGPEQDPVPCPVCTAPVLPNSHGVIPSHVAPEHEVAYQANLTKPLRERRRVRYCDAAGHRINDARTIALDRAESVTPGRYQRPHP